MADKGFCPGAKVCPVRTEDSGVALSAPASSLAFRHPYRVQLEAQPPHALHMFPLRLRLCALHMCLYCRSLLLAARSSRSKRVRPVLP